MARFYIAVGLKGLVAHKITLWDKIMGSCNQSGLKVNHCQVEVLLYLLSTGICSLLQSIHRYHVDTRKVIKLSDLVVPCCLII